MHLPPPELVSFPHDLFGRLAVPGGDLGEEADGKGWWVVHTRARAEKALARQLAVGSVPFFLPLYPSPKTLKTGEPDTYLPLFTGYLFVWGDATARYQALATNRVASCLPVNDQQRLESDLLGIYRLMTGLAAVKPAPTLPAGTLVELIDGPFVGLSGVIVGVGADRNLVVEVEILKRGVTVNIQDWAVRPLGDTADVSWRRRKLLLAAR